MIAMMSPVSTHFLGEKMADYCKSLILDKIKVEPIPPIYFEIYNECHKLKNKYYRSYRSLVIRIVDNDDYVIEFNAENAKIK